MNSKKVFSILIALISLFTLNLSACNHGGVNSLYNSGTSDGFITDKPPLELSPKEVFLAFIEKAGSLSSYEISAEGTSTAKVLFLDVTQNVKSGTVKKDGEYFTYNKSDSKFVHTSFCAFFKDGKVAYDENNTEPKSLTVKTESEYREIYGVLPSDKSLNGFIINEQNIISAEKLSENLDGTISYKITLDGNKAGANVQKQMKKFGDLNSYPDFKQTCFILVVKNDWTPVSLSTDFSYVISASFVSNTTCTEHVTYSYSKINGVDEIPNRNSFINALA